MGNAAIRRISTALPAGSDSSIPNSVAKTAQLGLCIIFNQPMESTRSRIVFPPRLTALNPLYSIPGTLRNRHPIIDVNDYVVPVPHIAPSPADRSGDGITVPIADDDVIPVPLTTQGAGEDIIPDPAHVVPHSGVDVKRIQAPAIIRKAVRPVYYGDPCEYMNNEFLKLCFKCKKEIGEMVDIYMYKDMSFCGDDCHNQEVDKDFVNELKNCEKQKKIRRNRRNIPPKGNDMVTFFIGDA